MTILFAGSENIEFTPDAVFADDTNTYRTGYSRMALYVNNDLHALAPFSSPASEFWTTERNKIGNVAYPMIWHEFRRSGVAKLRLKYVAGQFLQAVRVDAGAETILETSTLATTANLLIPLQMHVKLGAQGRFQVWWNEQLFIDWSGDLTLDVSDIDSVHLRTSGSGSYNRNFNEFIVTDEDPRTFSVVSLYPNGVGQYSELTGTYANVDESVINDGDVLYSETVGAKTTVATTDLPAGSFIVKGLRITARAAKGTSGPGSVKLGFYLSGQEWWSDPIAVTTGWTNVSVYLHTNPLTMNRFTSAELNAIQLGVQIAA